jgi:3-isopropylmalate/(R)-2-methylmalate dehydratase small subunit
MQAFTVHKGLVAPMDRANVDTDAIIPKQFLKSIKRSGFGPNLFDEWRYLDKGEPGPGHRHAQAQPGLRAEPAALPGRQRAAGAQELRLRLQPRARALGAGAVRLSRADRAELRRHLLQQLLQERLFKECEASEGYQITVDLEQKKVIRPNGESFSFEVDDFRRHCLLNGLDDIGLTLQVADDIRAFEEKAKVARPWVFQSLR